MTPEIRLATTEDVPALQQLIRESVVGLSAAYYTPEQITSALSHVFGVDTQLITDGTYFVVEVGNDIVASGGWSRRKTLFGGDQMKSEQGEASLDPANEAARIRAFYVHPKWARRGIGSLILTACEAAARATGFRGIELVATLPGEPLYLSHGYEKLEPMQLETPDGESLPAFRMIKSL
jgi:N-acetylglutamate synthase-like GNAT family acetyltransferase